jgi:VWFA-related protein
MRLMKSLKTSARLDNLLKLSSQLLLFSLLFAGVAPAQEPTFHSQSNVVIVPTLVKDKQGKAVYGLEAKDFIIEDEGTEQSVRLDETIDAEPVSLVVAIQTGGRADYEFARMRGLSSMLDPVLSEGYTQVAIVEFDSHVQLAQDFTDSSQKIAADLNDLKPGDGGAAILDAVKFSVDSLNQAPQGRQRVLLLISETRDHGSHLAEIDEVVKLIGDSNTVVYALPFSPGMSNVLDTMRGNNKGEMNAGPDLLAPFLLAVEGMRKNIPKTVAEMTGGEYELFKTRNSFETSMLGFDNHLHSRYLLSFVPKNPHPGLHKIRVRLRDSEATTVLARDSYWAGKGLE